MAIKQDKPSSSPDQESEVWNAIMAFEQILEAIPNDRTSLETLSDAYEQIGDLTKAKDYTLRLAKVILDEADNESAAGILPKIQHYASEDPAVKDLLKKIENLTKLAATPPKADGKPDEKNVAIPGSSPASIHHVATAAATPAAEIKSAFNITSELSFAWNLMKSNDLSQEEYSSLVQDLTEMSSTDATVTVSVLHVLNDRGFKNLFKIMVSVAKDCGTPILNLSSFDIQATAYSLLPPEFMIRRGVLPFELFGKDCLAVIMNPYDKQLMKDVESITGRKFHFFLTLPAEFDSAMAKIVATLQDKGADNIKPAKKG